MRRQNPPRRERPSRALVSATLAIYAGLKETKKENDMSFEYDPEDASSSWPKASYEASIEKVEETISKKSGDPMLIVRYKIYGGPGGSTQDLADYITNPPKGSGRKGSLYKLRSIAMVVGLYEEFQSGKLRPKQLVGKNLVVNLGQRIDPQYGDSNTIESYGKLERPMAIAGAAGAGDDEEVPF